MKKLLKKIVTALVWILIWEAVTLFVNNSIILAGPIDTVKRLAELLTQKTFYEDIFGSLIRIVLALVFSVSIAAFSAAVSYRFSAVKEFLSPFVSFIKSVPVAAISVILLIMTGSKNITFFVSFMVVFPIVYENILEGLDETPKDILEMAGVYHISAFRKMVYIYLPQVMKHLSGSIKSIVGICFKSGVAAEIIGLPVCSLGSGIYKSKIVLDTAGVFAYTVVVVLLSIFLEKIVELGASKISPENWKYINIRPSIKTGEISDFRELELQEVSFSYQEESILEAFDGRYKPGQIYYLDSPSGTGKTTLLNIISGLRIPQKGKLVPDKVKVSYQFQEDRLISYLGAYQNIALVSDKYSEEEIKQMINDFIPGAEGKKVSELSGGMKRRVSLLRALCYDSEWILLDEPFAGLDEENIMLANTYIKKLSDKRGVIIATHIK